MSKTNKINNEQSSKLSAGGSKYQGHVCCFCVCVYMCFCLVVICVLSFCFLHSFISLTIYKCIYIYVCLVFLMVGHLIFMTPVRLMIVLVLRRFPPTRVYVSWAAGPQKRVKLLVVDVLLKTQNMFTHVVLHVC